MSDPDISGRLLASDSLDSVIADPDAHIDARLELDATAGASEGLAGRSVVASHERTKCHFDWASLAQAHCGIILESARRTAVERPGDTKNLSLVYGPGFLSEKQDPTRRYLHLVHWLAPTMRQGRCASMVMSQVAMFVSCVVCYAEQH